MSSQAEHVGAGRLGRRSKGEGKCGFDSRHPLQTVIPLAVIAFPSPRMRCRAQPNSSPSNSGSMAIGAGR